MSFDFSRRSLMKGICSTAALSAAVGLPSAAAEYKGPHGPGMPQEGPNTPKICAPIDGREITSESMRQIKQLGVDNVLMGGPKMPWQEADLQAIVDKLKTGGLKAGNMMIAGFNNCIYGRAGEARDKEIEDFKSSVRAAGKVGLPVIEYNWYAPRHRGLLPGRGARRSRADRVQHQQGGKPADSAGRRRALE
jgi:mannonate dehydratase